MTRPAVAAAALALALSACGPAGTPAGAPAPASTARDAPATPAAAPTPAGNGDVAGTGDPVSATEPATDEQVVAPGSDAEDTRYFDFSGAALAHMRSQARPATSELRDAARRLVDATGEERGCDAWPEGERLFMLDLDGRPGDEALLLYTMEGCWDGGNYYDRSGYVLRETGGEWRPVAEFPLGTKMVGNAVISEIEPGLIVVSPEGDSLFEQVRVEIPVP